MIVTQANWPSIVQRDLSEVFLDQWRDWESMLPLLFRYVNATQGTQNDLETGDVGSVPVFKGAITFDDFKEGFKQQTSEIEYALGLKVQRRLLRNDLYDVVRDRVGLLAQSFREKQEAIGASEFVNAFNTTHTTGDGLQLCSSAHTSKVGGTNQSNLGSSGLSAANVEATRQLMVKFRTNRDNIMRTTPDLLLVSTENHEKAWEIINSYGKMETSNNNRNFHYGKYNLAVWDNFLSDANDWWMIDSRKMKRYNKYTIWEPVSFFKSGEFDTISQKYAGYMSQNINSIEWRWIFGHQVS